MIENNDKKDQDKSKKLTLSAPKLTLNRNIGSSMVRQSFSKSGGSGGITVEVKKSTSLNSPNLLSKKLSSTDNNISGIDDDLNRRISLVKRASIEAKNKEEEQQIRLQKRIDEENSISNFFEPNLKNDDIKNSDDRSHITEKPSDNSSKSIVSDLNENKNIKHSVVTKVKVKTYEEDEEEIEKKKHSLSKVAAPKILKEDNKKIKKNLLISIADSDDEQEVGIRTRSLASIRRAREKEKRKAHPKPAEKIFREVILPELITVGELSSRMTERAADVIKELMKLGIIANASQSIDADTAEIVIETMGHRCKRIKESDVENILDIPVDNLEDLINRAPVVTVMGHVDHGKTSLLDALKSTDVASKEAGGITQHIGAYKVTLESGDSITFLDTPGHEAFTEMRSRGAKVTDIVVLVVAADDGIMPQTIEAINHAKAANVPIIVAINKIDKPDANIEKVKSELLQHNLIPEDLGGDIIVVPVSAKNKINLDKLEESILLVAEMLDLKANPNCQASGTVIEAKIDKGRGVVATILVQRGTLKIGDIVVAGETFGKVKKMIDGKSRSIEECMPSEPVEIWGLDNAPLAGDSVSVVQTEKLARDITEYRLRKTQEKRNVKEKDATNIDDLFLRASGAANIKDLPIIIKGDVQGSIEAIISSINKIDNPEIKIKILHKAVGAVTESDISLASASNALIIAFNVRANPKALVEAEKESIKINYYSIIYSLIDDVRSIVTGMLSPIFREEFLGTAEIREVFNITKVGKVAGCYVTKGLIKRGSSARIIRDNIVIFQGKIKTLKRFKEDVKEVKDNYECGIVVENYTDLRQGDIIEAFEIIEEKRVL